MSFIDAFEKKVCHCDDTCEHFYVKRRYKNDTIHYELYCTKHHYLLTVPHEIAEDNIANGAIFVFSDVGKVKVGYVTHLFRVKQRKRKQRSKEGQA